MPLSHKNLVQLQNLRRAKRRNRMHPAIFWLVLLLVVVVLFGCGAT